MVLVPSEKYLFLHPFVHATPEDSQFPTVAIQETMAKIISCAQI
jgi:hypothetical protein